MSTAKVIKEVDWRAGYQTGWRDAILGEASIPAPQQTQEFRDGYNQGYADASARPKRRTK